MDDLGRRLRRMSGWLNRVVGIALLAALLVVDGTLLRTNAIGVESLFIMGIILLLAVILLPLRLCDMNTGVPTRKALWNVLLRFDGSRGRSRSHTLVHHKRLAVGGRHRICYGPKVPGRRSTILAEWDET